MLKNINNLINKNSVKDSLNSESDKKEQNTKSNNFDKKTKNQRFGARKSIKLNNNTSTIKLSKSFKSNLTLKENRIHFQTSNNVIDEEVEEEKDVPWIREEDC